jgi:hypothetical protein
MQELHAANTKLQEQLAAATAINAQVFLDSNRDLLYSSVKTASLSC